MDIRYILVLGELSQVDLRRQILKIHEDWVVHISLYQILPSLLVAVKIT